MTVLRHSTPIVLPEVMIWEEQINANNDRSYKVTSQPASPPSSSSFAKSVSPKNGISLMVANHDGTLLVTRNDACPTTAWIWSLQTGKAITVLIHHSPIRQLTWSPSQSTVLLIHCAIPEPAIHLWNSDWNEPIAMTLPLEKADGRLEASWLQSCKEDTFNVMLSSPTRSATARISGTGQLLPHMEEAGERLKCSGTGPEDMFDEGNSLELSPIKIEATAGFGSLNDSGSAFSMGDEGIDDTFHYRRQVKATG